jgi:hypothetical protein
VKKLSATKFDPSLEDLKTKAAFEFAAIDENSKSYSDRHRFKKDDMTQAVQDSLIPTGFS